MKKCHQITWSFLLIFFIPISVHAIDGYYTGAFLRMGLGARANAMGGAFTGVADGPEAAYYNPAGIPMLEKSRLALSHRFLSLDRNFNYIGFATGIRPKVDETSGEKAIKGGVALSWIHAGVDKIDGRDFAGNHYKYFSNAENAFALSFGVMPMQYLAIGFTGQVFYNRFPDMGEGDATISSTGLGLDVGVLLTPFPFLSMGVVIKNINAKYDWKTDKLWEKDIEKIDRFPKSVRAGFGLRYPYPWLLVAADVEKSDLLGWKYYFGAEAQLIERMFLRTGLNDGAPAFGGGFVFQLLSKTSQIQYAFVTKKYDADSEHIFSWSILF